MLNQVNAWQHLEILTNLNKQIIKKYTMKLLPIIIALGFLACAGNTNEVSKNKKEKVYPEECSPFFLFQNNVLDLESLVFVDAAKPVNGFYNDCSIFSHRFKIEEEVDIEPEGRHYSLHIDDDEGIYQLLYHNDRLCTNIVELPVDRPLADVRDYDAFILEFEDYIVVVIKDFYGSDFIVCKYNLEAELVDEIRIEHSYITHPDPNTNHYHPYLYYYSKTNTQIVFSSGPDFSEKDKCVILTVDDFTVEEFEQTVGGLILDEKESDIIGFASVIENTIDVFLFDGRKFDFELEYADPSCDFILKGDKLYFANYHPISTGSALYCYDLSKDKLSWTADVKQIYASHSEYYNTVVIGLYKDKILMYGLEAYGEYIQVFNAENGERLAAFGDFIDYE